MSEQDVALLRPRFAAVEAAVEAACRTAGRTRDSVTVVGVVKKQAPAAIDAFVRWCRERAQPAVIGVNYVQEYRAVSPQLVERPDKVHFIGRLQKNKARDAVALFDVIETVDSPELARVLDAAALRTGKIQAVLLQVNISADEQKGGFTPDSVAKFLEGEGRTLSHLSIQGVMTITRFYETAAEARPDFRRLADLLRALPVGIGSALSMGMSQDFEVAIAEGATSVRLGTALFGERKAS